MTFKESVRKSFLLYELSPYPKINFSIRAIHYIYIPLFAISFGLAVVVQGEAQAIFVLIPLHLYWLLASTYLIILKSYLRFSHKEVDLSFKRLTSQLIFTPFVLSLMLMFLLG